MGLEGPTEPRPEIEAEVEGSVEAPKAGTVIGTPATPGATMGVRPTCCDTQGAPSSQKSAMPRAR